MKQCRRIKLMLLGPIVSAGIATGSTASMAQSLMLEEVIVTARKREQSMQDVSVAVTALSDSILKDAQLANTEDLATLVPSLNLQKGGNPRQSSFNIRGIGTRSFSSGVEPSVSTVVDGVVMGRSGMAFTQLLDIQRVEVLRGPQGTLFGKNSSGGAIHIISKDPSDDFEAEVSATAVERNEYRLGFTVSNSINPQWGFRLTGSAINNDGYISNEFNGEDINTSDSWNLRAKLVWNPSDTLEFKWIGDFGRRDGDCCTQTVRSIDAFPSITVGEANSQANILATIQPVVPSFENTAVNLDGDQFLDNESSGHSLEITWDIGGHTLTSISALRDWDQSQASDNDFQPIQGIVIQSAEDEQQQFTQELRLTSPAEQFASYILGLYYFDLDIDRRFSRTLFPGNAVLEGTAVSDIAVDTLNYAAFGEATFNLSDAFRIVAGARFTHDEVDFEFERISTSPFQPSQAPFSRTVEEDDFSIKLTTEWDVSETVMAYFTFAQGYKGPAFNVVAGSTPANTSPVQAETADAFELGLKSTLFDGALVLNVAAFFTEYSDFQAQSSEAILILDENGNPRDLDMNGTNDTQFSFVLANVGEVSTMGLEIDFIAQVSESLSLFGGLSLIEAEIDSYLNGPCSFSQQTRGVGFNGQTGCEVQPASPGGGAPAPRVQDLSGGELPDSPDWKFTLAANYFMPLERWPFDLVFKANYRIQDDVQYRIEQDRFTIQESYDVLDFSVELKDKNERYSVNAFVKNVLDDFHVTSINATNENIIPNGYSQQVPKTARRTAGIEFRYRWL